MEHSHEAESRCELAFLLLKLSILRKAFLALPSVCLSSLTQTIYGSRLRPVNSFSDGSCGADSEVRNLKVPFSTSAAIFIPMPFVKPDEDYFQSGTSLHAFSRPSAGPEGTARQDDGRIAVKLWDLPAQCASVSILAHHTCMCACPFLASTCVSMLRKTKGGGM